MSFTFPSNHISTEKMREALRAAAQVARARRQVLTPRLYLIIRTRRHAQKAWPSPKAIFARYGNWSAALTDAGVPFA